MVIYTRAAPAPVRDTHYKCLKMAHFGSSEKDVIEPFDGEHLNNVIMYTIIIRGNVPPRTAMASSYELL